MNPKDQQVLLDATRLAESAHSWAAFSNALFNPFDGIVAKAFPEYDERVRFSGTGEYRAIRDLLRQVKRKKKERIGGPEEYVQIPGSLQESLAVEASQKGMAFDQLVLTKLAQPLP